MISFLASFCETDPAFPGPTLNGPTSIINRKSLSFTADFLGDDMDITPKLKKSTEIRSDRPGTPSLVPSSPGSKSQSPPFPHNTTPPLTPAPLTPLSLVKGSPVPPPHPKTPPTSASPVAPIFPTKPAIFSNSSKLPDPLTPTKAPPYTVTPAPSPTKTNLSNSDEVLAPRSLSLHSHSPSPALTPPAASRGGLSGPRGDGARERTVEQGSPVHPLILQRRHSEPPPVDMSLLLGIHSAYSSTGQLSSTRPDIQPRKDNSNTVYNNPNNTKSDNNKSSEVLMIAGKYMKISMHYLENNAIQDALGNLELCSSTLST